jgi:hypothetical protein
MEQIIPDYDKGTEMKPITIEQEIVSTRTELALNDPRTVSLLFANRLTGENRMIC